MRERIRIVDFRWDWIGLDNGIGNFFGTRLCCVLKSLKLPFSFLGIIIILLFNLILLLLVLTCYSL